MDILKPHSLSIHPGTYRDVAGFRIQGCPPNDRRSLSIFARTRAGAERIMAAYKDESLTTEERQRIVDSNL